MKTNLLFFCLFLIPFSVFAQMHDPASWSTLIYDININKTLRDTFLIQSFEDSPSENWLWEDVGNQKSEIVNLSTYNIKGGDRGNFLRLPVGSQIKWTVSGYESYNAFYITFLVAASGVENGTMLAVSSNLRETGVFNHSLVINAKNYPQNFRETFNYNGKDREHIYVYTNPIDLTLRPHNGSQGSFFIDNIIAYGDRPRYTHFTGKGQWEDASRWSLLPPTNRRRGLINGDVEIAGNEACGEIHLSDGNIILHKNASLKHQLSYLYGNNIGIYTEGSYEVTKQVFLLKDFPQKGGWYFVSFPFDVYRSGVDESFVLKDEAPNDGGDFYYVLCYDGKKRSEKNQSHGNWKVVSDNYPADVPLFERGKGYLIALDEKATKQQLLFTSREGEGITWDSREFIFSLDIPGRSSGTDEENHGWVLCGNPFPAPMRVKHIVPTSQLEPTVYYFDGNQYIALPMDGEAQIPPFSAYFIKASSSCNVRLRPPVNPSVSPALSPGNSLKNKMEPSFVSSSFPASEKKQKSFYELRGKNISIENAGQGGELLICTVAGSVVFRRPVPAGKSFFSLPLPKGIYILSIQAGNERTYDKFVLYE